MAITNPDIADLLRIMVITTNGAVLGLGVVVIVLYLRVWLRSDRKHLLPGHVWAVASSYLVYVGAAIGDMVARLGTPVTWRLPIFLLASLIGAAALSMLVDYEWQRLRAVERLARAVED